MDISLVWLDLNKQKSEVSVCDQHAKEVKSINQRWNKKLIAQWLLGSITFCEWEEKTEKINSIQPENPLTKPNTMAMTNGWYSSHQSARRRNETTKKNRQTCHRRCEQVQIKPLVTGWDEGRECAGWVFLYTNSQIIVFLPPCFSFLCRWTEISLIFPTTTTKHANLLLNLFFFRFQKAFFREKRRKKKKYLISSGFQLKILLLCNAPPIARQATPLFSIIAAHWPVDSIN
jgi:hypothetical protein